MSIKRTLTCAGAAVLTVTALAACSSGSTSKSSASTKLSVGALFASVNFNPWLAPNGPNASLQYTSAAYDSLTKLTGASTVGPDLATSWKLTSSTTLQMTLRTGVTFSDGTPLDAAAVKANIDYVKKASPAGVLNAFIASLTTTVINPTTVQFSSSTPVGDLPFDFATGGGFIANPKSLTNPAGLTNTPDGSGPYTLASAGTTSGQQYTFTRRASYWNKSAYPYDTVVLKIFTSPEAMDAALRSGQIQVGQGSPQTDKADQAAGLNIVAGPQDTSTGIWLNDRAGTIVKALGDVRVRQALNYAIDRKTLMAAAFGPTGTATSLVVGPGTTGYAANAAASYPYDPAKAKTLLAAAGYPHGFTLPVLSTQSGDLVVQAVAGYLRAVGVNVKISDHNTDFVQQAFSGKWAAMVFEYGMQPAAQSLASLLSPAGLGNPNHSTDTAIESLITESLASSGASQTTAINQLVARVNDQAWFVMLGSNGLTYSTAKSVTCTNLGLMTCVLPSVQPSK